MFHVKHFLSSYAQINTGYNERITTSSQSFDAVDRWEEYKDAIPNFLDTSLKSNMILEHMNMTKDESDYLWYTFRYAPLFGCILCKS